MEVGFNAIIPPPSHPIRVMGFFSPESEIATDKKIKFRPIEPSVNRAVGHSALGSFNYIFHTNDENRYLTSNIKFEYQTFD